MILEEEPGLDGSAGAASEVLHERILKTFRGTRNILLEMYEDDSRDRIVAELVPQVWRASEEALDLLGEVLEVYEPTEGGLTDYDGRQPPGFLRRVDRLMADLESRSRISDVAFLGRVELRRKLATLLAATEGHHDDPWRILGHAGSCLRGLRKALTAVEVSLCEHAGLISRLSYQDEVLLSIQVRRAYARFRADLRRYALLPELADWLGGAATSIARLVGRDIYTDLRIEDRAEIRRLQNRILDWHIDRDPVLGLQLWQDVQGFAELIGEVRKRQELMTHDQQLARQLRLRLKTENHSDNALAELLAPLTGLDDTLDDFLLFRLGPAESSLESHLQQLFDNLI